jgi:hypothetical protein
VQKHPFSDMKADKMGSEIKRGQETNGKLLLLL